MALDLGELVARLRADSSQLDKGLAESRGKLASFGSKAAPIMAGAGLAAGAAFAGATMQAIDNEAIADTAAAAYANPEQAKLAGDVAGKLYAGGWGAGLVEVNESVNSVLTSIGSMEDASAADVQSMTAKVMDLSKVMGIDVPRAAQVIGQSVRSGLAEDATQGVDLLTKALQIVPTNLREDLVDAVDEYGPFLTSVGITGERAFGMLAHAADKGMYGIDKTGDAIKEFTLRATSGSDATNAAFKAIGLNGTKMAQDLSQGGEKGAAAFQKTVKGLMAIDDPAKRAQTAIALFGTPLEDLNVSEIPKFLASLDATKAGMGGFEGAAAQLSKTVNDNAATNIESFKRQVTTAFVDVLGNRALPAVKAASAYLAENFGPAMQRAGNWISGTLVPALRDAASWIEANRGPLTVVAGIITAVFLPALAAMAVQAGISAAATAAAWVTSQAAAIASVAVQSGQIVLMIGRWVVMGAVALAQGAAVAAGWLLALGPIGLLIAATVLVVGLIIANWGRVKGWLGAFWSWLEGAFSAGVRMVVNLSRQGFLGPVPWIISNWGRVLGWFRALPGQISALFGRLVRIVLDLSRRGFLGPIPWILSNWGRIVAFFRELPGKILAFLSSLPGRMYNAGAQMIRMLASGMASQAQAAVNKIRDIASSIADYIPGSPVRTGPLRSLNNGRAGRLMMAMLTDGVVRGAGGLQAAMAGAVALPALGGRGVLPAGVLAARSAPPVLVRLDFGGGSDPFTRALRETVRVKGGGETQAAFGRREI